MGRNPLILLLGGAEMVRGASSVRPVGLKLFCGLTAVSAFLGVIQAFQPNTQMILAGTILKGGAFQILYAAISVSWLAAASGLFLLRKWALSMVLGLTFLSAALIIINILAVDATVLEHAGRTHPESDLSVYRWVQGIGLMIALMIGMWAFRYAPLLDLNAKGAP